MGPDPWEGKYFYDEHNDEVDEVSPFVNVVITSITIPIMIVDAAINSSRQVAQFIGNHLRQGPSEK
jgi:hypothetical protein